MVPARQLDGRRSKGCTVGASPNVSPVLRSVFAMGMGGGWADLIEQSTAPPLLSTRLISHSRSGLHSQPGGFLTYIPSLYFSITAPFVCCPFFALPTLVCGAVGSIAPPDRPLFLISDPNSV